MQITSAESVVAMGAHREKSQIPGLGRVLQYAQRPYVTEMIQPLDIIWIENHQIFLVTISTF
jgi:hypothetical protein